ncbi:STAS domain-containing protein [Amycolatopsis sp., V23-08]|uniref:STAS domain-containing protein n=1 Tax=Amycolatopsis heterodermiae TaxID=3110235 RepID=A0ABU5R447_9PSEU|nr:STAS domain-containing protein [Amycolatopsis sp., V23-08]MEA5360991.1 STAS domain-containing protein [Amycolatopsis sp., V23-08]
MDHTAAAPLRITMEHTATAVVLGADGEIDLATTDFFSTVLAGAIAGRPPLLVVDLGLVHFLSCQGVSVLVAAHQLAGTTTRMVVAAPSQAAWRPLSLTGADRLLNVRRRREGAVPARLRMNTVVTDAAVLVVASGGSPSGDAGPVTDELRRADGRDDLFFDASACALPVEVLARAVHEAGREDVRVLTADPRFAAALDVVGVAHSRTAVVD